MSEQARPPIGIRAATTDDREFICDSWVRSWYHFRPQPFDGAHRMDGPLYKAEQWKIVEAHIGTVLVGEAEGAIVGWVSASAMCLHYAYTRQKFRRLGVARLLVAELGPLTQFSHWTPLVQYLVPREAEYNPYAARRPA